MKKDRQSKIDYIKGLVNGTRSINELFNPGIVVLYPADSIPATLSTIEPPHGAEYFDQTRNLFLSAEQLRDFQQLNPMVEIILIHFNG